LTDYAKIEAQYENPVYFKNVSDLSQNEERARWFRGYLGLPDGAFILELGAGKFTLTQAWQNMGMNAWGVEWSEFGCYHYVEGAIRAMCQFLPFKPKSFDFVTAFDVYEHIPPEDLDLTLADLARVAREHIAINVPFESINPEDHHHLTKLDRKGWSSLFARYFTEDQLPDEPVAGFNGNATLFMLRVRN
jgi:ubiquinone/menaquinone biosynthesis C-methylase UbiE